jgi:hypothetical protein
LGGPNAGGELGEQLSRFTKIPENCTQNPDEVPREVCPGYNYKSDTILFRSIDLRPGFDYKPIDEFRDLGASKQLSRPFSGILVPRDSSCGTW